MALNFVARNEHGCLDVRSLRNLGASTKTLFGVVALSPSWAKWYQEHFQGSAAWAKTLEMSETDPTVWSRHFLVLYRKFVELHDWDSSKVADMLVPKAFCQGFVIDETAFVVGSKLVAVSKIGPRQREMLRINVTEGRVVSKLQLLEGELLLAWDGKTHVVVGRHEVLKEAAELLLTVYDATTLEKLRTYTVAVAASAAPRKCKAAMDDGCIAFVLRGQDGDVVVMAVDRGTGAKLYEHSVGRMKAVDCCVEHGNVRVLGPRAFFRISATGVQESAYPHGAGLIFSEYQPGHVEPCSGPRKEIIWLDEDGVDSLYKWDPARGEYIPLATMDRPSSGEPCTWCSDGHVAPYFDVDVEPGCWFNLYCIGNKFERKFYESGRVDAMTKAMACCLWMLVLLTSRAFRESDFKYAEWPSQLQVTDPSVPITRIVTYDFTRTVLDKLL